MRSGIGLRVNCIGGTMGREENCFFCGGRDHEDDQLVGWFVNAERRNTHIVCWMRAYRIDHELRTPGREGISV
jgi:hypothetical protein